MKLYSKIFISVLFLYIFALPGNADGQRKAPAGWIWWQSGATNAPVESRVEIDVRECQAAILTLQSDDRELKFNIGKLNRRNKVTHRYAISVVQDRLNKDQLVVRQYKDGELAVPEYKCLKPSGNWAVSLSDSTIRQSLDVYVPDPNHRISASRLDYSNEAEKFIQDLLEKMTLDEKIGQLSQYVAGNLMTGPDAEKLSDSLVRRDMIGSVLNASGSQALRDIQEKYLAESRLKIPILFGMDVIHGYRTLFPVPVAEACSWDLEMMEENARIAAIEASAAGVHWTFAPMVDIARDARWGRIVEGAGEDTWLGAKIAEARVRGFQWNLWADNSVMACGKHWLAYGLPQAGRDYAPVDMSDRTLYDVYLPPFKAAYDAGAMTFMSAFHDLNGIPASGDRKMLKSFLREEWSFDGFVVSDWQSVEQLVAQGVAKDKQEAARIAFNAGVDMDMTDGVYNRHLHSLTDQGLVSEADIDDAVRRILRVKYSLGLFENPFKFFDEEKEKKILANSEFLLKAREAACKSMVLLKNDGGILPLSKDVSSIALIGPLADDRHEINGSWRCRALDSDAVTVRDGLKRKLGESVVINYSIGCRFDGEDRSGFEDAIQKAASSDVIIAVMGEKALFSGESRSRARLGLPGVQEELVNELASLGKPMVLVLMNGRPLCIEKLSKSVPAILEAWFPGTTTGDALSDILFGDRNPSGRLVASFPRVEGQLPCYYNYKRSGRPGDMQFSSTVRHIDVPNAPLYPFGYGLSYTTFSYGTPSTEKKIYSRRDKIKVCVEVTNTGSRQGEETVQVYVSDKVASVVRPVMELKGFSKVTLEPGETRTVEIVLDPLSFGFYNQDMDYVVEDGEFDILVGHDSSDLECISIKLED